MTILAALHEPGVGTWIGSDSLVCADNETRGFTQKWIVRGRAALGICGTNAVQTLLTEALEFDASTGPVELFKRIVAALKEHEFRPKAPEGETPVWDFSVLVATPERIASINGCGSVITRFIGGFAAKGSGASYAEGAAWAFARTGMKPREIVEGSLAAAMAFDRACGGEAWVGCLKLAD